MPVRKRKPSRKKSKGLSLQLKFAIASVLLVLLSPFYYGYVLKVASTTWFWLRHPSDDQNYRTYESYEIKIPKKYSIHGIDVSYYQGKIDWQKVSAMNDDGVKITFAFIKATEGILNVDPYFQRNWREAPKSGIKVGAYHFFRPRKSGLWQANFFLQTVSMEKGDLPPVVDVESLDGVSPEKMRKELNAFVIRVEERTNVKPIIYTGLKFYQSYLAQYYQDYPFWVAHYHQAKLKLNDKAWKFWQHSDKASINGIHH
ncbi:MAG TPA: GH25 family lysozyme, partial [Pedobacter sp.]|nr:GH25 family lysozyme [Pedobacter sp.]